MSSSAMSSFARMSLALIAGALMLEAPMVTAAAAADKFPPSVIALNQKMKDGGVSITYANFPEKGTLAILEREAGHRHGEKRIGHVAVDAGDHRNIHVSLSPQPSPGAHLTAVVERGNGKTGKPAAEQTFKVL